MAVALLVIVAGFVFCGSHKPFFMLVSMKDTAKRVTSRLANQCVSKCNSRQQILRVMATMSRKEKKSKEWHRNNPPQLQWTRFYKGVRNIEEMIVSFTNGTGGWAGEEGFHKQKNENGSMSHSAKIINQSKPKAECKTWNFETTGKKHEKKYFKTQAWARSSERDMGYIPRIDQMG